MAGPSSVTLFTYRVGFGDCFLLRFTYPSSKKHVLIDFGSTAAPQRMNESPMKAIAKDIAEKCDGKLDAVIVTHRHSDHISGFAGETWKTIRSLEPGLVLLPWTEDPGAAPDAKKATRTSSPRAAVGLRSSLYIGALAAMHEVAQATLDELKAKGNETELARLAGKVASQRPADDEDDEEWEPSTRPFGMGLTKQLGFLGEENLKNAPAVKNLMTLPREFLSFGSKTKLETLLPGVKITVLGPPTLEQSAAIKDERDTDPNEFWHLSARALDQSAGKAPSPFPKVKGSPLSRQPVEVRWFVKRLEAMRGEELLELVRILDSALNNTSLILLFEACGKKLLFPGDAQIENWSYALSKSDVKKLLADVDVYKVGHHGSLNATPKTLWNLFKNKGQKKKTLQTFLSTRPGKHGSSQRGTEVPRSKLVTELKKESTLHSTLDLSGKALFIEEEIAP